MTKQAETVCGARYPEMDYHVSCERTEGHGGAHRGKSITRPVEVQWPRTQTQELRILDPGHKYSLSALDGQRYQELIFVKREGVMYPGNIGHYPGTTTQEVMRACIDRLKYVDAQIPDPVNEQAIEHLRQVIWLLEERAFRRHGLHLDIPTDGIEHRPTNSSGHLWARLEGSR